MNISKANWHTDGNTLRCSMPISKVDQERRLVSGWATLNNVDRQNDITEPDASARAFSRFRGNIREMHENIAAGRMIDFQEGEFYDQETNQTFKGIFVTVYVSKGAESTWEKVLDGTLTGFSIGGTILEADSVFDHDLGKSIRVIKDYELIELSLVDSPANPLANVFSIEKSDSGDKITGMLSDAHVENVFWCESDKLAKSVSADNYSCPACSVEMKNIGWFDSDLHKSEKIAEIVKSFTDEGGVTEVPELNENVETTQEVVDTPGVEAQSPTLEGEVVETGTETHEVVKPEVETDEQGEPTETETATEVVKEDEAPAAEVEAAEEVSEETEAVAEEGDAVEKAIAALSDTIRKSQDETSAKLAEIETRLQKAQDLFDERVDTLKKEHTALTERFDSVTTQLGEVQKGLQLIEGSTALRKSADLGGSTEAPKSKANGLWGGSIFG